MFYKTRYYKTKLNNLMTTRVLYSAKQVNGEIILFASKRTNVKYMNTLHCRCISWPSGGDDADEPSSNLEQCILIFTSLIELVFR